MDKNVISRILGGAAIGGILLTGVAATASADTDTSILTRQSREAAPKVAVSLPQSTTPSTPLPSASSAPVAPSAGFAEPTSRVASFVGCTRDASGNAFVDIDVTVTGGKWSTTTQYNPSDIHLDGAPYTRHFKMLTSSGVVAFNPTWTYLPRDIGTISLFDIQSGVSHRYLPENPVTVNFSDCR